jgi:hypothetical protein
VRQGLAVFAVVERSVLEWDFGMAKIFDDLQRGRQLSSSQRRSAGMTKTVPRDRAQPSVECRKCQHRTLSPAAFLRRDELHQLDAEPAAGSWLELRGNGHPMLVPVTDPFTSLEDGIRSLLTSQLDLFVQMGRNLFRGFATILIAWFGVQAALSSAEGGEGFSFTRFTYMGTREDVF